MPSAVKQGHCAECGLGPVICVQCLRGEECCIQATGCADWEDPDVQELIETLEDTEDDEGEEE